MSSLSHSNAFRPNERPVGGQSCASTNPRARTFFDTRVLRVSLSVPHNGVVTPQAARAGAVASTRPNGVVVGRIFDDAPARRLTVGLVHSRWGRLVVCVTLASFVGCLATQPVMDGPCRDSLGRFASCSSGSGGDSETTLAVLGVAAGLLAVSGIVYLATRPSSPPQTVTEPSSYQPVTLPSPSACAFPVDTVQVCQSTRGYRFAIPSPETCAPGSYATGVARLTCEARERPAYHACINVRGEWVSLRSWESCRVFNMTDAPGDFVPPGRTPEQGVVPDSQVVRVATAEPALPPRLRCYAPGGALVEFEGSGTCAQRGYRDTPTPAPTAAPSPVMTGEPSTTTTSEATASEDADDAEDAADTEHASSVPPPHVRRETAPSRAESSAVPVYRRAPRYRAPSYESSSGGTVHVRGHYRRNGTYVRPYTRRRRR